MLRIAVAREEIGFSVPPALLHLQLGIITLRDRGQGVAGGVARDMVRGVGPQIPDTCGEDAPAVVIVVVDGFGQYGFGVRSGVRRTLFHPKVVKRRFGPEQQTRDVPGRFHTASRRTVPPLRTRVELYRPSGLPVRRLRAIVPAGRQRDDSQDKMV